MRRDFAAGALAVAGILLAASALAEGPVTRTSRPVRLLRNWEETVKAPNGREYKRRVELVFDYAGGFARERYYYNDDVRSYGWRDIKQSQPSPSPEEIEEAQDLVRRDPELGRIVTRKNAVLEGGFILEEGRGRRCGPGSRCLQIQLLSPDRAGLVRWTVVDLARSEIAYAVFVPKGARP